MLGGGPLGPPPKWLRTRRSWFSQFGDLERASLREDSLSSADDWHPVLEPIVARARYAVFQMAEVTVPKPLFRPILERIRRLRLPETVPR